MNVNDVMNSINTDKELVEILSNFSDDFIIEVVEESFKHRFRPYYTRMPNLPASVTANIDARIFCYTGNPEPLVQRKQDIYLLIIRVICNYYNLQITQDISNEHLYPLCFNMYKLFVSEFTDVLIRFFADYISTHKDLILSGLTDEQKVPKTTNSKKMYIDPAQIAIYENIESVLDMVASLDIDFATLLNMITDFNTAQLITTYIADTGGNFFGNYFASYINDQLTKTDMITSIKTRFADYTINLMQQQEVAVKEG